MRTNESTQSKDALDLIKQGLSTFHYIAQMARYRYLYTRGKELQNDGSIHNSIELDHNRTQMIKYTCLTGLCILGLFAIGISGLRSRV